MTMLDRVVAMPGCDAGVLAIRSGSRRGPPVRGASVCAILWAALVVPFMAMSQSAASAREEMRTRVPDPAPAAQGQPSTAAAAASVQAGEPAGTDSAVMEFQSLDTETQALRKEVLELNRELFLLEEELLFPASTQVAIYVSYDVGTFFALDAVKILVDDKDVANYLYTAREVEALQRGGVHRVWLGNLKVGRHVVTAFFNGKGPHGRDYRSGATLEIEKGVGAKYLELEISDRQLKLQPEFIVKQWD